MPNLNPNRRPLLVPEDARRTAPRDHLVRAVTAMIVAKARRPTAFVHEADGIEALKRTWPDDRASELVLRAAVSGATTTASGWAAELAGSAVADFVGGLGPSSASGALFRQALGVPFERNATITVPGLAPILGAFVGEGAAIPVRRGTLTAATITPRKISIIVPYSLELAKRSNFEAIVRATLTESVSLTLDSILFDTNAGSAVRPAGLRNGVTALTATAGGTSDALRRDLGQLAGAVAAVAGSSITFVADPASAVKIAFEMGGSFQYQVLASNTLTAGTVIALAPNALAVAVDPTPEIDVSNDALLHMEDTTPGQFTTSGTAVSHPSVSMFQTGQAALRLTLAVNWGLRATGGVSWLTSATW